MDKGRKRKDMSEENITRNEGLRKTLERDNKVNKDKDGIET